MDLKKRGGVLKIYRRDGESIFLMDEDGEIIGEIRIAGIRERSVDVRLMMPDDMDILRDELLFRKDHGAEMISRWRNRE